MKNGNQRGENIWRLVAENGVKMKYHRYRRNG